MFSNFALAWLVSLAYIGTKAWQQKNVQHNLYWAMPVPSYIMAACEVFVFSLVARHYDDLSSLIVLALSIGTGAWMGSMLGTYLHARKRR